MQIRIELQKLLAEIGLDRRGIVHEIATCLGYHRHTIGKLYRNEAPNPSLKVLGDVCEWLELNGIPSEQLPQALFGRSPEQLWEACTRQGRVTIYIGENRAQTASHLQPLWISKRDTALAFDLIQLLCNPQTAGRPGTAIHTEFVPYHSPLGSKTARSFAPLHFEKDKQHAIKTFQQIRQRPASTILIGSVKSNYLVECFVAHLFGCEPFVPPTNECRPPIYVQYRKTDRKVPSCMAGDEAPCGFSKAARPGVYYLGDEGNWEASPYLDTGTLIVLFEASTQTFFLAASGFRGRTTAALARPLQQEAQRFWPTAEIAPGKWVGVYLCGFSFKASQATLEWSTVISDARIRERLKT